MNIKQNCGEGRGGVLELLYCLGWMSSHLSSYASMPLFSGYLNNLLRTNNNGNGLKHLAIFSRIKIEWFPKEWEKSDRIDGEG